MIRFLVLAVLGTAAFNAASAQSFRRLGFGLSNATTSVPTGVSEDGLKTIGTNGAAFVWSENAGFRYLPDGTGNIFRSQVRGVNKNGSYLVGWAPGPAPNDDRPAVWTLIDTTYVFGGLSTPSFGGDVDVGAYDVSSNDSVVVGIVTADFDEALFGREFRAVRWVQGAFGYLGDMGFPNSTAVAVSADGSTVVGDVRNSSGLSVAAMWGRQGPLVLGTLPGGTISQALAVDSTGSIVVGWSTRDGGGREAFRWDSTSGMVGLGFPPGYSTSEARSISGDGTVIGGVLNNAYAGIWREETGFQPIQTILILAGLQEELEGWSLSVISDISDDGKTLVGAGRNPQLQTEGFIIHMESEIIVTVDGDEENDPASLSENKCDVDRGLAGDQCTLRAAIELANQRDGATIKFDIPGPGVPTIQVTDYEAIDGSPFSQGLPRFDSRIILDATTQPGGWVELIGTGIRGSHDGTVADAIQIGPDADGSIVRGLVINRFVGSLIHVMPGADNCVIEGNRLGTDVSGTTAMGTPPYFFIDYNPSNSPYPWFNDLYPIWGAIRIGSEDTAVHDNVIAGNADVRPLLVSGEPGFFGGIDIFLDPQSRRTQILRNLIGVGVNGVDVTVYRSGVDVCCRPEYVGVFVQGASHQIGDTDGNGNTFGGHSREILLRSPSGNQILGNTIGPQTGSDFPFEWNAAIVAPDRENRLGDPDGLPGRLRIESNVIRSPNEAIATGGDTDIVGNQIEGWIGGWTEPPTSGQSMFHRNAAVFMGDNVHLVDNEIKAPGWAVLVDGTENVVSDNSIVDVYGGIRVENTGGNDSSALLSRNNISSRQMGIDLDGGTGDIIQRHGVTINDVTDRDDGPNGLLNYPVLLQTSRSGGTVQVNGFVQGIATGAYVVEVFANASCSNAQFGGIRFGAGQAYLGAVNVSLELTDFGEAPFSFLKGGLGDEPVFITLTSSRPAEFATSEFGHCLPVVPSDQAASVVVEAAAIRTVFDDSDLTVAITATDDLAAAKSSDNERRSTNHEGGTLYVTRYNAQPVPGPFDGHEATSPGGGTILPAAVTWRSWLLTDLGLTPERGAEAGTGAIFRVCLNPTEVVFPDQTSNVVLVRRSESSSGNWVPYPTTLESDGPVSYLCAEGLTALGEFGIGGLESAFPVGTEEVAHESFPSRLSLETWPNPSKGRATVLVDLPKPGAVRLDVFDALGRRVARLFDGELPAGNHPLEFSGDRLPSGIYFLRLTAGNDVVATRLTIVR